MSHDSGINEHASELPNWTCSRKLSQDVGHQVVNVSNSDARSDETLRRVMGLERFIASMVQGVC